MAQEGERTATAALMISYCCLQDAALAKHVLMEGISSQICTTNSLGVSLEFSWNSDQKITTVLSQQLILTWFVSHFLRIKEQMLKPGIYELGLATNFNFISIWREGVGPSKVSLSRSTLRNATLSPSPKHFPWEHCCTPATGHDWACNYTNTQRTEEAAIPVPAVSS